MAVDVSERGTAAKPSRGTTLRALVVGEAPYRSAPSATLAQSLRPLGIEFDYSAGREIGPTGRWLRAVRASDLVLCVAYDGPEPFVVRQLSLAALLGRPVARWWVGSDVLTCLRHPALGAAAKTLDRSVGLNIAVAPHLVDELASLGIAAEFIPSVLAPRMVPPPEGPGEIGRSVLVYLPENRSRFYGEDVVRLAINANPDLHFIIVADDAHRFAGADNVTSVGWVDDLDPVLARIGCLLRVTEHDGLPRMVLECLLRGRYVVYSWPFPGCWLARRFDEVQACLEKFRRRTEPNHEGIAAAREVLRPDPSSVFAAKLRRMVQQHGLPRRLRAAANAFSLTVTQKLGRLVSRAHRNAE